MNWLLDAVLICLFALTVLIYALRGIIDSIWGALSAAAAFALSYLFGGAAGDLIHSAGLFGSEEQEKTARLLSSILGYVAVFLAAVLVLSIIGLLLKKLAGQSVVKTVNRILGGLLGAVAGFAYVWLACLVLGFLVEKGLAGDATGTLKTLCENSFVFRFVLGISPLDYISLGDAVDRIRELLGI
jgi:membrane protein required for colicin V production